MARRERTHAWIPYAGVGYLAFFWTTLTWLLVTRLGLFHAVGGDFAAFHAAGTAFREDGPASVYDLNVLAQHLEHFKSYYASEDAALKVLPVPYPPVLILLIMPFAMLPPVYGYIAWSLVNAGLCAAVAWDISRRMRAVNWIVVSAALLSLPVIMALWAGQPFGFLLLFFYLAYRALERGHDLRAGVWIGLLLIKPQLAIGLVCVLLFKRRWRALAGAAIARGSVALSSLAVLGLDGLLAFYRSVIEHATSPPPIATADVKEEMISLRGVIAALGHALPDSEQLIATVTLSVMALAVLPLLWRGGWQPGEPHFALRMLATSIVTVLVGYDMHVHGALVLIVPAMIVVLRDDSPPMVRAMILTVLYVLPLIFPLAVMSLVFVLLMLITLSVITFGERSRQAEGSLRPSALTGDS